MGTEILSDMLFDMGISGVEMFNPDDIDDLLNKKNEYDWDYIDTSVMEQMQDEPYVSFYLDFNLEQDICVEEELQKNVVLQHNTIKQIQEQLELLRHKGEQSEKQNINMGNLRFDIEVVDDSDWKDKWKEYFKPAHITDRIVVKPSWEEYEKAPGELVIEIDPGQAFGTGTHPTTTGCITLMEKYIKENSRVLDVGCGSGILAIAAGLLGAEDVLGIEIDPQAVEVGKENVALNGFSDKVKVCYGDLTKGVDYKADVVVANLMADLVVMLSKDVARHLNDGGIYISSGILLELKDKISKEIEKCGFEIIEIYENENDGGWCAIAARLK